MISVLYVDDDTSLLEIGKLLIEKEGLIRVDTSTSAGDAMEKISNTRYDVIISDYAMPVMNGIQFLKQLRSGGDTTPFFFFAGKGRKSVIIEALNRGADYYVEKGGNAKAEFEELMDAIQRVTAQKSPIPAGVPADMIETSVLEALDDGVLIVDQDGKITAFNRQFLTLFSIPEDLAGTTSDSAVLLKYIGDHLADPGDFSQTPAACTTDPGFIVQGAIHGMENTTFTYSSRPRKSGDTLCGRIWSFRDISDHYRTSLQLMTLQEQLDAAEEEVGSLRREREHAQALIHTDEEILDIISRSVSDGILTSVAGTIVTANERGAALLGYRAAELEGRSLSDLISPESGGNLMTGTGERCAFVARHRNGSSLRGEASGYPVRKGEDTLLVWIVHGVSGTQGTVPEEKTPERDGILPDTGSDTAATTPESSSGPRPDEEIPPEPVVAPVIPDGISIREPISPAWEIDEEHLSAVTGELQPPEDPDLTSLITEIDDIIGPDESRSAHRERWYTPDLRQRFSEWKRRKIF